MNSSKKAFFAVLMVVAVGFFSRLSAADPVASTMPAAPLPQSSAVLPMESQEERSLRAEVMDVRGEALVQKQGSKEFAPLVNGTILHAGDVIKTRVGSCRLLIDGKTKVAITPISVLKISSESLLELQSGNIMVKLAKLKKGSTFEVSTPTAVAVVRGTTLYLQTGNGFSKLYVDETRGGVVWKNIFSGNSVLVGGFSLSGAFADGKMDEPNKLTPEQKEAFFKEWQNASGSNLSQQFGIEEVALPPPGAIINPPDLQNIPDLNDAQLDKLAEQNIPGSNGFAPSPATGPTEEELQAQERAMIHQALADLMGAQAFDSADAQQARIADAQTGKVFTDVHGKRVRVEQYISQTVVSPTEETGPFTPFTMVSMLSLTARTGDYLTGVSALEFLTAFNRVLAESDGTLKDLPWNDYMRVITRDDLNGGNVPSFYEQFIVHEHRGDTGTAPDLYPVSFSVAMTTPLQTSPSAVQGSLLFGEIYSNPFHVDAAQGSFWIQGMDADLMQLTQRTGDTLDLVIRTTTLFGSNSEGPFTQRLSTVNETNVIFGHSDGVQTAGLANDPRIAGLQDQTGAGVNAFRNSETHPAFFEERYTILGNAGLDDYRLIGMFFPIDNAGKILNPEGGFNLRGLRDVVHPDPLVNGGKYNLELLFVFGHGDDTNFTETFRIDALVTPEIFTDFGIKNPDTGLVDQSSVFPFHFDDANNG